MRVETAHLPTSFFPIDGSDDITRLTGTQPAWGTVQLPADEDITSPVTSHRRGKQLIEISSGNSPSKHEEEEDAILDIESLPPPPPPVSLHRRRSQQIRLTQLPPELTLPVMTCVLWGVAEKARKVLDIDTDQQAG